MPLETDLLSGDPGGGGLAMGVGVAIIFGPEYLTKQEGEWLENVVV